MRPELERFGRYAVVGLIQNGVNLLVFALGLHLGLSFILAAVLAAIAALALSFVLNRRWTFQATGQTPRRAARFVFVWLAALLLAL